MTEDIKNLIANTKNPEGLARIFDNVADRLEEIVAARRRESADRRSEDGGADGK